jgi:hypothetical protein
MRTRVLRSYCKMAVNAFRPAGSGGDRPVTEDRRINMGMTDARTARTNGRQW